MRRLDASRTWFVYRGVESFALALGWTLAPIYFVQDVVMSPLHGIRAALAAGALALTPALVLYVLAARHEPHQLGLEAVPQPEA